MDDIEQVSGGDHFFMLGLIKNVGNTIWPVLQKNGDGCMPVAK